MDGIKSRMSIISTISELFIEITANVFLKEEKIRDPKIGKEGMKLSIFSDVLTVYLENSREPMMKLIQIEKYLAKITGFKIDTQN